MDYIKKLDTNNLFNTKMKTDYNLPEILIPELNYLEKRLHKSIKWVEENRNDIHPSISSIEAASLYDMGIDVTQLDPTIN